MSCIHYKSLHELQGIATQASSQLYMDAIDILADQDEGKEALSGDLFRQAIGMHKPSRPLRALSHLAP